MQGVKHCYKGLQGFTKSYKVLQGVLVGYKGLVGVTGGYKGLQVVTGRSFYIEYKRVWTIKTLVSKTLRIYIFPKGLVYGFGEKLKIFF